MTPLSKGLLLGLLIIIILILINKVYSTGTIIRNERLAYQYVDNYNLMNKRISFGINTDESFKARYVQLYGSVDSPLIITGIFINDIQFPFCHLGLKTLLLEKTSDDSYKLVKLDLGREYDIKKIEIHCDPLTTKSLKTFKILLRDFKMRKVWESNDFLKPQPTNVIIPKK